MGTEYTKKGIPSRESSEHSLSITIRGYVPEPYSSKPILIFKPYLRCTFAEDLSDLYGLHRVLSAHLEYSFFVLVNYCLGVAMFY